jgi:hypothetical protein
VLREHTSVLYVIDAGIAPDAFRAAVQQCHPQTVTSLGSWRHQQLELVRR